MAFLFQLVDKFEYLRLYGNVERRRGLVADKYIGVCSEARWLLLCAGAYPPENSKGYCLYLIEGSGMPTSSRSFKALTFAYGAVIL